MYEPLTYDQYEYPVWANVVGWMIALSSILCMPGLAIIKFISLSGSPTEVRFTFCLSVTFLFIRTFMIIEIFGQILL